MYCAVSDVQAEFKSLPLTGTFVTSASVTQMIVEASALIDSYVGQRWVTPITGDASSVALMSLYARTLVADRVRGVLANRQQTNTDPNAQVKSDGFSVKNVMQSLENIRLGNQQLSGATLLLANAGFFSNNNDTGQSGTVRKNSRQW